MKIAIISPNKTHLQEMGRVLEVQSRRVLLIEGGKNKKRAREFVQFLLQDENLQPYVEGSLGR